MNFSPPRTPRHQSTQPLSSSRRKPGSIGPFRNTVWIPFCNGMTAFCESWCPWCLGGEKIVNPYPIFNFWHRYMCFIMLACLVPFQAVAEESDLPVWIIDPGQSSITFEATQMGAKFEGEFKTFKGDIVFDPERLSESRVAITVDIASVTTYSPDRDTYIVMAPWLNVESFPESSFVAYEFRKDKENQYIALGELRIRDVTLKLELPFTLRFNLDEHDQDVVAMESNFVINRLDYGVGQGEWRDTKMVGNAITVRVILIAAKQHPRVP